MRRRTIVVLTSGAVVGLAVGVGAFHVRARPRAAPVTSWVLLPEAEKRPDFFEPYLAKHPEDEIHRSAAVAWYSRIAGDVEQLRRHTLILAKHHPENTDILFTNTTAFYADPAYRVEVSRVLEKHVDKGMAKAGTYWMLGEMYRRAAVPPRFDDEDSRKRFLRYFGLPDDVPLPDSLDASKAEMATTYYRRAMQVQHEFWSKMAAESLVSLLVRLDKANEAASLCKAELDSMHEVLESDFLATCGRAMHKAGQLEEASRILSMVRDVDREGHEGGPAHATTNALTRLGLIAVETGDLKEASRILLASADVEKCCHNTTQGMPLKLANRLYDAGEFAVVADYCQLVLDRFTPGQRETIALLERAQHALATSRSP